MINYYSNSSEIKIPDLSPSEYEKIEQIFQNKLKVAISATCIEIMKCSTDPVIRTTTEILEELLKDQINLIKHDLPEPSKIDYYDLMVPLENKHVSIGTYESSTVKISPKSVGHVSLIIKRDNGNDFCTLSTSQKNLSVSVCLDSNISSEFITFNGPFTKENIVRSGSIIRIGLSEIRLNGPR